MQKLKQNEREVKKKKKDAKNVPALFTQPSKTRINPK